MGNSNMWSDLMSKSKLKIDFEFRLRISMSDFDFDVEFRFREPWEETEINLRGVLKREFGFLAIFSFWGKTGLLEN